MNTSNHNDETATVYSVDFKHKRLRKKSGKYLQYPWVCAVCGQQYIYDSRNKENTRYVSSHHLNVCQHCIEDMYELINE